MAEDTRLKHSTERFYVKNQSNNQSNQPQHPQQTIHTEKLLKETTYYNNIDYTIMAHSQQIVLDYLLSSEKGEILKWNGQELKKLKIGEKRSVRFFCPGILVRFMLALCVHGSLNGRRGRGFKKEGLEETCGQGVSLLRWP